MKGISYRIIKDCMIFKCTADYEKELYQSFILFIKKTLLEKHRNKLIVDLRYVKGDIPDFDRFELGVSLAKNMGSKYSMGILSLKEKINKFAENVAVNRGANVFVSYDLNEILQWFKKL